MFIRSLPRSLALAVSVIVLSVFAAAQDLDNVTIVGKVTDANALPVAGASVTATMTETSESRTVTSDDEGGYKIVNLKPGTYKVTATGQGFGVIATEPVKTISAQTLTQDFKLVPADVKAETTITVSEDDGPAVDTSRITVGGTITEREVEELPNSSRNALDLVLTLGGTSEEQLSTNGLADDRGQAARDAPLEQGNFSISGGTAYSNNLTVDGLDNNDDRSSRDRFQPSLESIAEVQVISNQFSAEYGRASGGRINIRTRAGGNKFRGRAFFFFRDESLNANTWYNNSRGIARPSMQERDPGFTLSGPVIVPKIFNGRKKTFFFVSYENDHLDDTTLIDAYLPVVPNPKYTTPAPTGSQQFCDATGSPAPPCAAGVAALQAYNKVYATPNVSNVFTARVDSKLFHNNDVTFGYQYQNKNNRRTSGTAVNRLESAFQARNNNTTAYNFTDNWVIGSNTVNQYRMQWSRYEPSFEAPNPFDPVVIVGYRDPVSNSVKSLVMGNSTTSSGSNFPDTRNETRWQFQDSLTEIIGRHTWKVGFDIQNVNSQVIGLGDATGTFNFSNANAYSTNVISRYRQNFGTAQTVVNRYYGGFVNDQMRFGRTVTFSAGLRYERETAVDDHNNWGPRVGVSWDPFKTGKGVIRAGAGIFYNRVLLRTVADSIQNTGGSLVSFDTNAIGTSAADARRTAILAAINGIFPGSYSGAAALRSVVSSVCSTYISGGGALPCNQNTGFTTGNVSSAGNPLRTVESNLVIPESYQFNIGFERELIKNWVFEANFTWNKTVHLWRDTNRNAPSLALANSKLGTNYADWTAYLNGRTYDLSATRHYIFFLGDAGDTTGTHATTTTGATCTTTTVTCYVNLNSSNGSTTEPVVAVTNQNTAATGAPIGIALAAIAQFRPDPTAEEESLIGSRGNALYKGLILELRSRYRKLGHGFGASYRFNYTLSKTMDDGLNNTSNAEINGDFSREWARSLQDRRHRVNFYATFDTPAWMGKLRFSPLFRWGSSAPFALGNGGSDRNLDDLSTDRLNFSGNLSDIVWREPGSPIPTTLLSQFSLPPIGAKGSNLPRNAGTGPRFYTLDLNVTREWKLSDRMRLRPVLEIDNILNAAVFNYGAAFIDFGVTPAAQSAFLVPTRTYRQRQMRAGIRFDF